MFEVARGITAIDTFYGGRERYTAAYLLDADEPAIVETGPTTSFEPVVAGLERLGIGPADLAHIAVTHIHLDHAGGVGRIAERFPNATVWVHERGARHLADPTRLVASVTSIYGPETTATLFGPVEPVAAQRIRALADGDRIELGGRHLEALATPGPRQASRGARGLLDGRRLHRRRARDPPARRTLAPAGDAATRLRPRARASPRSRASANGRARARPVLAFRSRPRGRTVCDLAAERFRTWTEAVGDALERGLEPDRDDALDEVMRVLRDVARSDAQTGAEAELDLQAMETMSSIRLNAMGILGYWRRRRAADGAGSGELSRALRRVERARVVAQDLAELAQRVGTPARLLEDVPRSRTRRGAPRSRRRRRACGPGGASRAPGRTCPDRRARSRPTITASAFAASGTPWPRAPPPRAAPPGRAGRATAGESAMMWF